MGIDRMDHLSSLLLFLLFHDDGWQAQRLADARPAKPPLGGARLPGREASSGQQASERARNNLLERPALATCNLQPI